MSPGDLISSCGKTVATVTEGSGWSRLALPGEEHVVYVAGTPEGFKVMSECRIDKQGGEESTRILHKTNYQEGELMQLADGMVFRARRGKERGAL